MSCSARDVAGNAAEAVTFTVTVNPPPAPTATAPTTTEGTSTPTEGPTATGSTTGAVAETTTAAAADAPTTSAAAPATDPSPSAVPSTAPSAAPTPIPSQHPDVVGAASGATRVADGVPASAEVAASPRPALQLPWPPPSAFVLVTDGGPLDGLAAIWRYEEFPVTQEFGHTLFSILHHAWYAYGAAYGLDGYEHPGLDIGMPAGTWLYSPVSGTVKIAGGVPYFTFYGNGRPGVGQLMIETDDGDQVILGHMGLIAVEAGQRVEVGQFVGLSGGENGDHLHLEARELQLGGGYRAVDPRQSFLIAVLKAASERAAAEMTVDEGDGMR